MENELKDKMLKKAVEFSRVQNEYYTDKMNDEDITEIATQPFWQSMRLNKRRLQEKNLTVVTERKKEPKESILNEKEFSDGRNVVGTFERIGVEEKKVFRNGEEIFSKKDEKKCTISLLRAEGNGEEAVCPNCGALGKISTFIDGCDYCQSKFKVEDFEEKISAFSVEENTEKKVRVVLKNLAFILLGILGISVVVFVAAFILAIIFSITDVNLKAETNMSIVVMFLFQLIPIVFKLFLSTGIILVIVGGAIYVKCKDRIVNAGVVKKVMPGFSEYDFAQNLEYKLRNIHYAKEAKEVNVFTHFDLSQEIKKYEDVIDCSMVKLKFLQAKETAAGYEIDAEANLLLMKYNGKRVKEESEKVTFRMSARKGLDEKNVGAIRRYPCPNCGSNISLLEGGICEYCGTSLDYDKYSWMFEEYKSLGKTTNLYKKTKAQLIGIYLIILLVESFMQYLSDPRTFYQLMHMPECFELSQDTFDMVDTFDDVVRRSELIEEEIGYVDRRQVYSTPDGLDSCEEYIEYLEEEGFYVESRYEDSRGRERIILLRKLEDIPEEFGVESHSIEMIYEDGEVTVKNNLEEFDEE